MKAKDETSLMSIKQRREKGNGFGELRRRKAASKREILKGNYLEREERKEHYWEGKATGKVRRLEVI